MFKRFNRSSLDEDFLRAATLNQIELVEKTLNQGANINYLNDLGVSAVSVSVLKNNINMIRFLASKGADVNIDPGEGYTPLIMSVVENKPEALNELLACGADIYKRDHKNRTALQVALLIEYSQNKNRSEVITELVNFCDNVKHDDLFTNAEYALIEAARRNDIQAIENLINAGMFLDFQDMYNNKRTALIESILNGNTEIALKLISAGAKTDLQSDNFFRFSAIGWASLKGYEDVIDELIFAGADLNLEHNYTSIVHTPLLHAVRNNFENIAIKLIEAGANTNCYAYSDYDDENNYDENGNYAKKYTPLILAAAGGNITIIEKLIEYGAEINFQNIVGETALMTAARNKNHNVMSTLTRLGSDANIKNKDGKTAFEIFLDNEE